jgi:hypothetical protein
MAGDGNASMRTLDQFFHPPTDLVLHPRLRSWKERLGMPGVSATVSVFRPESVIGRSPTELNVQFIEDGKPSSLETVLWDDDLNAGLVNFGVRAESNHQEAERFALALRAAMRPAAMEFGDGFLNSVLLKFVQESDLVDDPAIAVVVKHAYALNADTASRNYRPCLEMIEGAIAGRARELTEKLKYSEPEAKQILLQALSRYLDNRFTVSYRRRLGLL